VDLEGRMKILEDQMKILKNEIQGALVDIQEQILVHYYPALRAEGPSPSKEIMESLQPALPERRREEPEMSAPPRPTRGSSLKDIVKSIESLSEEKEGAPEDARTSPDRQPPSRSKKGVGRPPFIKLAAWVSDSVESIGREHTRETIELYAKGEYLAPEVKDTLLQFVSLCDSEETPPDKVGMKETLDVMQKLDKALSQETVAAAPPPVEEEDPWIR